MDHQQMQNVGPHVRVGFSRRAQWGQTWDGLGSLGQECILRCVTGVGASGYSRGLGQPMLGPISVQGECRGPDLTSRVSRENQGVTVRDGLGRSWREAGCHA